ncbi:SDR family oxidoreductase [Luteimonas aquatica]|uniref:SDR family oxidoreductase n=1 Tax=Luteimonas aquatica TaxID=450364 RepID=UPI001F577C63|nr:SDR family oxidoreductase [Luteimonas aquatica]
MRKTILITGASSGLGAGLAREFARRGRHLALCARRVERLEALKAELEAAHPDIRVSVRALDVGRYEDVFTVFRDFAAEFGALDRVIVNAGMGKGASLGTGYFHANRATAETNFVAALAQCEAALEIFRAQNAGHLVTVASISALRGMPRAMTVYGATKAGLAALSEGIRSDLHATPIRVTTLFPGYIRSEINEKLKRTPFIVDTGTGCRLLAAAIEREPAKAYVPWWPWAPLGFLIKRLPLGLVRRIT